MAKKHKEEERNPKRAPASHTKRHTIERVGAFKMLTFSGSASSSGSPKPTPRPRR